MKKKLLVGGTAMGATALATGWLVMSEGIVTQTYIDPVGVPTYCVGETKNAKIGETFTKEFCIELLEARTKGFQDAVSETLTVQHTPRMLAAYTHFSYNIGKAGWRKSNALRLTNSGLYGLGCEAMGNWYRAGGRDCRVKSNNCYGLINRRNYEIEQCKLGVQELREWEAQQDVEVEETPAEAETLSFWDKVKAFFNG